jgi:Skp family chaperone for outer membrane proteins
MHRPIGRTVFLGFLLVLCGSLAAAPAAQGSDSRVADASVKKAADKGTRYRFVNLNKVLEGWSKAKKNQEDFAAEFDKRAEALRQKLNDLQKSLELKTFQQAGSSEEVRKREREIKLGNEELKIDTDQLQKDRNERRLRLLLSAYQQIQDVVAKWASKNDVDAVFVIQEEDPADADLLGKYERALVRQVLWYSKDLDISEEVVKLLEVAAPAPLIAPANGPASRPANSGGGNK